MNSVIDLWFFTIGVSPFGNPRVKAYFQLTVAYRRLSRPSSALGAKAFTLCSFSLEQLLLLFVLSRFASCLSFANNCLGCGSQKDLSFCSSTVFSTESFDSLAKLFGIHLCIPPLYRKDLLISQLKNLLNTTICFVSYSLFGFQ